MTHSSPDDQLAAVLFDMDGTLLDSEKIWDIAIDDLAQRLGGRMTVAGRAAMVGTPMMRSLELVEADLGVPVDRETASAFLLDRTEELFRTRLVWKPGARELLVNVHDAGIPAALVTSTHRRLTDVALETIGREYFAASVCGDETERTKPDPQPYERAMSLLGVEPSRCVVIEDSPVGVAAGAAAGAAVLAVPSEVPLPPSPDYTLIDSLVGVTVEDLRELVAARSALPHR